MAVLAISEPNCLDQIAAVAHLFVQHGSREAFDDDTLAI
jgi:hypothetical protein